MTNCRSIVTSEPLTSRVQTSFSAAAHRRTHDTHDLFGIALPVVVREDASRGEYRTRPTLAEDIEHVRAVVIQRVLYPTSQ